MKKTRYYYYQKSKKFKKIKIKFLTNMDTLMYKRIKKTKYDI